MWAGFLLLLYNAWYFNVLTALQPLLREGLLYYQYCLFCFYVLLVTHLTYLGVCRAYLVCSASLVLLSGNFYCVDFYYIQLCPSLFAPLVITFLISLSRKFNYMLINTFLIYSHSHLIWLHLSLLLALWIVFSACFDDVYWDIDNKHCTSNTFWNISS